MRRICIIPKVSGVGGMVSFKGRFVVGLESRGFEITSGIDSKKPGIETILIIGGTRNIASLWRAKSRGIRIVQRLNGMNWMHRKLKIGVKHYLRAEYGNLILNIIRSRIADHIVYQSYFAEEWWESSHGLSQATSSVVYNAVDLNVFNPDAQDDETRFNKPEDRYRILMVEGNLAGGYELGLETAVNLAARLSKEHRFTLKKPVELMIAGQVSDQVKSVWSGKTNFQLIWTGLLPRNAIPGLDRSAHLLYSADIHAACPNSVIEALACGTPVLGFDTGALPEMVVDKSGVVVQYGSNPWDLEPPNFKSLAKGGVELLNNLGEYQIGARKRAVNAFGMDKMIEGYLLAFNML